MNTTKVNTNAPNNYATNYGIVPGGNQDANAVNNTTRTIEVADDSSRLKTTPDVKVLSKEVDSKEVQQNKICSWQGQVDKTFQGIHEEIRSIITSCKDAYDKTTATTDGDYYRDCILIPTLAREINEASKSATTRVKANINALIDGLNLENKERVKSFLQYTTSNLFCLMCIESFLINPKLPQDLWQNLDDGLCILQETIKLSVADSDFAKNIKETNNIIDFIKQIVTNSDLNLSENHVYNKENYIKYVLSSINFTSKILDRKKTAYEENVDPMYDQKEHDLAHEFSLNNPEQYNESLKLCKIWNLPNILKPFNTQITNDEYYKLAIKILEKKKEFSTYIQYEATKSINQKTPVAIDDRKISDISIVISKIKGWGNLTEDIQANIKNNCEWYFNKGFRFDIIERFAQHRVEMENANVFSDIKGNLDLWKIIEKHEWFIDNDKRCNELGEMYKKITDYFNKSSVKTFRPSDFQDLIEGLFGSECNGKHEQLNLLDKLATYWQEAPGKSDAYKQIYKIMGNNTSSILKEDNKFDDAIKLVIATFNFKNIDDIIECAILQMAFEQGLWTHLTECCILSKTGKHKINNVEVPTIQLYRRISKQDFELNWGERKKDTTIDMREYKNKAYSFTTCLDKLNYAKGGNIYELELDVPVFDIAFSLLTAPTFGCEQNEFVVFIDDTQPQPTYAKVINKK